MSDMHSPHGFEQVRRGYDPVQVNDRITKLIAERDAAHSRSASMEKRIEELHLETQNAQAQINDAEPSYAGLGARVEKILRLAEEEGVPPFLWRRRADTEALASLPKAERKRLHAVRINPHT